MVTGRLALVVKGSQLWVPPPGFDSRQLRNLTFWPQRHRLVPWAWETFGETVYNLKKNLVHTREELSNVLCSSCYKFELKWVNAKIITCLHNNPNEYKTMGKCQKSVFLQYIDFKNLMDIHDIYKLSLMNRNIKNLKPNNNRF